MAVFIERSEKKQIAAPYLTTGSRVALNCLREFGYAQRIPTPIKDGVIRKAKTPCSTSAVILVDGTLLLWIDHLCWAALFFAK